MAANQFFFHNASVRSLLVIHDNFCGDWPTNSEEINNNSWASELCQHLSHICPIQDIGYWSISLIPVPPLMVDQIFFAIMLKYIKLCASIPNLKGFCWFVRELSNIQWSSSENVDIILTLSKRHHYWGSSQNTVMNCAEFSRK